MNFDIGSGHDPPEVNTLPNITKFIDSTFKGVTSRPRRRENCLFTVSQTFLLEHSLNGIKVPTHGVATHCIAMVYGYYLADFGVLRMEIDLGNLLKLGRLKGCLKGLLIP